MVVVTSLCFYVKQFNINFHKKRTTFTAMFHEEHTFQNELLFSPAPGFDPQSIQPTVTRYTDYAIPDPPSSGGPL